MGTLDLNFDALALVALVLLLVGLGWRRLALGYERQLRARPPFPARIWVLRYRWPHAGSTVWVGAYASRALAEQARAQELASGTAYAPASGYEIEDYPLHQLPDRTPC